MRIVYVAGKFTGPTAWAIEQNIRAAEDLAMQVILCGAMPLCPHANTRYAHGSAPEDFFYEGTLELLRRCDAVIRVAGWEDSKGARREVAEAEARGMPVFDAPVQLVHWLVELGEGTRS